MAYTKTTLPVNNLQSMQVLEENGVLFNLNPIQKYYQLHLSDLVAGKTYPFTLSKAHNSRDLLPVILTGTTGDTSKNINNNDSLTLKVFEDTTYLWTFNLAGKKNIDNDGFYFVFPQIPVSGKYRLEITSSVALKKVTISCLPIFIDHEYIRAD